MEHDPSPEAHVEAFRQKIQEFQAKFPSDDTLAGIKNLDEIQETEVAVWNEFRPFVYRMRDLLQNILDKTENPDSENGKNMFQEILDFVKKIDTLLKEAQTKKQHSKADFYAWVKNRINPAVVNLQLLSILSEEELTSTLSDTNEEIENTK